MGLTRPGSTVMTVRRQFLKPTKILLKSTIMNLMFSPFSERTRISAYPPICPFLSTSIVHVCKQRRLWRELSLVAYAISTINSSAGSIAVFEFKDPVKTVQKFFDRFFFFFIICQLVLRIKSRHLFVQLRCSRCSRIRLS